VTREQAIELLNAHAARLSEHFDAVLVVASYMETDGTWTAVSAGEGSWYARLGMAAQFVEQARAEGIANEIARCREDEDEC
jgi:hypothetical protein